MHIALIGASGFIGSALRQELLTRGHQVTAFVSQPAKLAAQENLRVEASDVQDLARAHTAGQFRCGDQRI